MLGSCSTDDPTRVGRPPVVESFTPGTRSFTAYVGDVVEFRIRVFDPDSDPLTVEYTVDGVATASGDRFSFPVDETGDVTIRATVRDGEHVSFVEWHVEREIPINFPPMITAFLPLEPNPTLVIGNDMSFGVLAADPEGEPLAYRFTVDDVAVASVRQFTYHAAATGIKIVRATASDGVHAVSREWRLKVTEIPDAIPPGAIDIILAQTGTNPGEIDLQWIAVGKDGMTGVASQYRVRTLTTPIVTEDDWQRASERPDVPAPQNAGEVMSMTLTGLQPARETYLAIRAEDDFGNQSPLQESPLVMTRGMNISGIVLDARTNQPVPGASVSFGLRSATSDAAGAWELTELGMGTDYIAVRDEADPGIGTYYDYTLPYTIVHEDYVELFLLPDWPLQTTDYPDFLTWYRQMTDIAANPFGAQTRRWELPITLYVRGFSKSGLDYQAAIESVAQEFDAILGEPVFNVVTTGLNTGVETAYLENLVHDNYGVDEWTAEWYPRRGTIEFRTVYSEPTRSVLQMVARHELGHVLGMNHSTDWGHLMVGGVSPQVDYFSPDEIAVLQCQYHLPRGWDSRRFEFQ
ncbi:MAG TPA: matrixin family metalloprotease [Candidatus Krumholzibacteria bacterium]|nr:matrixin family metalloprotease [Candidatus Krumholzibacteria bacterium]